MDTANSESDSGTNFDLVCGLLLAVFAAVLAITDLFAGKFGDDEILASNEKSSAFMWYQSKSIKETLAEGHRGFLQSLIDSGSIAPDQREGVKSFIEKTDKEILRYGKDKREILEGSEKVGKENWSQAVEGELGKVIGAKEWEDKARRLGGVGDIFDMAVLFLQLSLVIGAISLIIKTDKAQKGFFILMNALGVIGFGIAVYAISEAMKI